MELEIMDNRGGLTSKEAFLQRSQSLERAVQRQHELKAEADVNNDLAGYNAAVKRLNKIDKFDLNRSVMWVDIVEDGKVVGREPSTIVQNLARRVPTMYETGQYDKDGTPKLKTLVNKDGELASIVNDPDGSLRRELTKLVSDRDEDFYNDENAQEFIRQVCNSNRSKFKIPTTEKITRNSDGTTDVDFTLEVNHKDIGKTITESADLLNGNERQLLQIR